MFFYYSKEIVYLPKENIYLNKINFGNYYLQLICKFEHFFPNNVMSHYLH